MNTCNVGDLGVASRSLEAGSLKSSIVGTRGETFLTERDLLDRAKPSRPGETFLTGGGFSGSTGEFGPESLKMSLGIEAISSSGPGFAVHSSIASPTSPSR
jgi:hypothetical protein